MKNTFKRILCLVLCLCMTVGTMMLLSSCNSEEPEVTETADPTEGKVSVVRALKKMEAGSKVERANFEEIWVDPDTVPTGAYGSISDVVNKFLTTTVFAGDYLVEDKLSTTALKNTDTENTTFHEDYVTVTKYTEGLKGDISDAIQKAIDENPNKTIYFPDGVYNVGKPIKTSADPAKAVSLRLSTYAVISAYGQDWKVEDAVLELGASDDVKSLDANYCVIGGVINANGMCGAINVNGGNVLINNVSIKQVWTGITIKKGARADVDSCVVIGNNKGEDANAVIDSEGNVKPGIVAIGVLVESEENTLTNMRLCHITVGIMVTAPNNVLRNLHPLFVNADESWSAGFWDISSGNFYDVCYSDQFAVAFRMSEDTKSIYNACFGYWYKGRKGNQYGFYADGDFNSIVRDTRVTLKAEYRNNVDLGYIVVKGDGGEGVVLFPRGIQTYTSNGQTFSVDNHQDDLNQYLKTVVLN